MQRSVLPVTSLAAVTLLASAANTAALPGPPHFHPGLLGSADSPAVARASAPAPRQKQSAVSTTAAPEWFGSWRRGPVGLLMTQLEVSIASQVRSEEEASDFLRWFWARRDAAPATARNEFRRRFRDRLAALAAGAFRDLTVWSYELKHLGYTHLRVPMVRIGGTLVLVTDRHDMHTASRLGELLRSAAASSVSRWRSALCGSSSSGSRARSLDLEICRSRRSSGPRACTDAGPRKSPRR